MGQRQLPVGGRGRLGPFSSWTWWGWRSFGLSGRRRTAGVRTCLHRSIPVDWSRHMHLCKDKPSLPGAGPAAAVVWCTLSIARSYGRRRQPTPQPHAVDTIRMTSAARSPCSLLSAASACTANKSVSYISRPAHIFFRGARPSIHPSTFLPVPRSPSPLPAAVRPPSCARHQTARGARACCGAIRLRHRRRSSVVVPSIVHPPSRHLRPSRRRLRPRPACVCMHVLTCVRACARACVYICVQRRAKANRIGCG